MPIDTSVTGSPGWWMSRLSKKLERDQKRFQILEDYYTGRPPLPWGTEETRSRFYRFQQQSRTNFAALIVRTPSDRTGLRSVATAADSDVDGDQEAWRLVTANDLDIAIADVARTSRKFGRAYLSVSAPDPGEELSVITAEDPRQVITEADPVRPRRIRAAFKLYHDSEAGLDVAVLWLPGEKWIATRERRATAFSSRRRSGRVLGVEEMPSVSFSPAGFDMAPFRDEAGAGDSVFFSERYETQDIPVEPILNDEGVGEFELHTDLLDRINHMILQRVVIATLQAFRQRAVEQSTDPTAPQLPEFDEAGNRIDYNDVFEAGPDATWLLPPGAKIWESQQADLQGILSSVKDDVLHLAVVTGTPMFMFTPDAATQTATGAAKQDDPLVYKVQRWNRSAGRSLARILGLAFHFMGDETRADASRIAINWLPAERYSLSEMGSAAAQAGTSLTWEQQQDIIWQQSPQEIAVAKSQRSEDLVLSQQIAALNAPAAPVAPRTVPVERPA